MHLALRIGWAYRCDYGWACGWACVLAAAAIGCRAAPLPAVSDAGATALHDEAGFVDVPALSSAAYPARMFYVFETADHDPASQPLVVFFNGGPGYATSLGFLAYGTARSTIDPTLPAGSPALADPSSWTSFANLLYIDERQSGFSYGLAGPGSAPADAAPCAFTPLDDAADFVRVVLRFLDTHPALRASPVMLTGASYGGERATLMLDLLLRYDAEAPKVDADLRGEIQAHYDAVFPDRAGQTVDPALAASQFGHAVLVQPLLFDGFQYDEQATLIASDPYVGQVPSGADVYDVREPTGWTDGRDDAVGATLADPASARALLTADPASIAGLGPAARSNAFRVPAAIGPGVAAANAALTASLGALQPADGYLRNAVSACTGAPLDTHDPTVSNAFASNLAAGVRTFITNARYDAVIYSPAIPATLNQWVPVAIDTAPRPGVDRPGWFTVSLPNGAGGASAIEVRFAPYAESGHLVNLSEPQHLHDDVAAWLGVRPGP